jgi:hypothetical protein
MAVPVVWWLITGRGITGDGYALCAGMALASVLVGCFARRKLAVG